MKNGRIVSHQHGTLVFAVRKETNHNPQDVVVSNGHRTLLSKAFPNQKKKGRVPCMGAWGGEQTNGEIPIRVNASPLEIT